jgi:hypothetical protein
MYDVNDIGRQLIMRDFPLGDLLIWLGLLLWLLVTIWCVTKGTLKTIHKIKRRP